MLDLPWIGFRLGPMWKLPLPIGLLFRYNLFIMKSISVKPKKKGRPATGKDPLVAFRSPDDLTSAIDVFASDQPDNPPRSEAIRRIIRDWLRSKGYLPAGE